MVDYTMATGAAGTMMIRDLGYQIQFHINSAYSATFVNGMAWSGRVNGSDVGGTFDYPSGSPWVHVASFDVGTTQDVRFSIGATGTSGFGGPTDFWVRIDRATVPGTPTNLQISNISHRSARLTFTVPGNGGAAIDQAHAEWRRVSDGVVVWDDALFGAGPDGSSPVGGTSDPSGVSPPVLFDPGTEYDVRVRMHNSVGWGNFSIRVSFRTLSGPRVKVGGTWRLSMAYVKVSGTWRPALVYVKVSGTWRLVGA